jgi:hypothetical protein
MEQEQQDQYDMKLFHGMKEEKEECFGHDYEFLEPLPSSEPDMFQELWIYIHCKHERLLT